MTQQDVRVAVVEDSRAEREALTVILRGYPGFQCVGAFANGEEAIEGLPGLNPDVILMDIHLPGVSGIECVRILRSMLPQARLLMLTVFEDGAHIFDALRAGAHGYLLKATRANDLLEAVCQVRDGGAPMSATIARQVVEAFHTSPESTEIMRLSPREREIVELLSQGFQYKEISEKIGIGIATVRTHIGRIYEKLHVRSRAEVMLKVFSKTPLAKR